MSSNKLKKFDIINIEASSGNIILENCLVTDIMKDGIKVIMLDKYINNEIEPAVPVRLFINSSLLFYSNANKDVLFYIVNTKHNIIKEAIECHIYNARK